MDEIKGVLSGSYNYLHTPSKNARDAYFYPVALGHFVCSTEYETERMNYDSFLLVMVHSQGNIRCHLLFGDSDTPPGKCHVT